MSPVFTRWLLLSLTLVIGCVDPPKPIPKKLPPVEEGERYSKDYPTGEEIKGVRAEVYASGDNGDFPGSVRICLIVSTKDPTIVYRTKGEGSLLIDDLGNAYPLVWSDPIELTSKEIAQTFLTLRVKIPPAVKRFSLIVPGEKGTHRLGFPRQYERRE